LIGVKVKRPVNILQRDEILNIHDASLKILEEIGVIFQDAEVLSLLEENGATVDRKSMLVKFSRDQVMKAIKLAPSKYLLFSKDGKDSAVIGEDNLVSRSTMSGTQLVDSIKKTRRLSTKNDVENAVKLIEGLDNIHLMGPCCIPQDVDQRVLDIHMWLPQFKYANKPLGSTYALSVETARAIFKMSEAVYGKEELERKPRIRYYVFEPRSPLVYEPLSLEIVKEFAVRNYPVLIAPMPMAGMTSPITIAGSLALHNAENLAGIVVTQLLKPGLPVSIGGGPCISDPRTGLFLWASPERVLMNIAYGQISKYYNLPSFLYGWHTESCVSDPQAAFEKTYLSFPAMMSGYNETIGVGSLGSEAFSFQQAVLDDEFLDAIFRIVEGFNIDDSTLAFDAVKRVGPSGNFITDTHTLKHLRKELRPLPLNSVFNVKRWENWESEGKKMTFEKAQEKADKIISAYSGDPLDKDVEKELEGIIKETERRVLS
jgi:trimethylamine--corrinoid protein Co-methyltransferase